MSMLTAPEPRVVDREHLESPGLVNDQGKTGGMPMTTPLPALWTESPLFAGEVPSYAG